MTLLAQIKSKQLQLRKERKSDLAASLSTFIGEAERIGKDDGNRETTEAETVAVLKKFIKNIDETIRVAGDYRDADRVEAAWEEKTLLEQFLPTQLDGTKLQFVVAAAIQTTGASTIKDMGKIMAELKSRYEGQFDGAEASKLIKAILTGGQ